MGKVKYPHTFIDGVEGKICTRCKKWNPLSQYHKNPTRYDGINYYCNTCVAEKRLDRLDKLIEYNKNYYAEHKEEMNAVSAAYYEEHREEINEYNRKWGQENLAYKVEYNKRWREEHPEHKERDSQHKQVYYLENKEHINARNKEWKKNNRGKVAAQGQNRRAKIKGNGGEWTDEEWSWLFSLLECKCLRCGLSIQELDVLGIPMTRDHVEPIDIGGLNIIENLQPLCLICNSKKHTKTIDYRPKWLIDNFTKLKAEAGFGDSILLRPSH